MKKTKSKSSANLTFAVYNSSGRYLFKKEFSSQNALTRYLNERASKGKQYFAVHLKGNNSKISEALIKKFEKQIEDAKSHLYPEDIDNLKALLKILKEHPAGEGMIKAANFDTIVRDEIPSEIWEAIGGETL